MANAKTADDLKRCKTWAMPFSNTTEGKPYGEEMTRLFVETKQRLGLK